MSPLLERQNKENFAGSQSREPEFVLNVPGLRRK
jgi:hypothetical protein